MYMVENSQDIMLYFKYFVYIIEAKWSDLW